MFDYLVMHTTSAQMAGVATETLRKSNDGAQCIVHRELVSTSQFNFLIIVAMMGAKPFSFATSEDIDALMLTNDWVVEETDNA
jgi:hypothetical protein